MHVHSLSEILGFNGRGYRPNGMGTINKEEPTPLKRRRAHWKTTWKGRRSLKKATEEEGREGKGRFNETTKKRSSKEKDKSHGVVQKRTAERKAFPVVLTCCGLVWHTQSHTHKDIQSLSF